MLSLSPGNLSSRSFMINPAHWVLEQNRDHPLGHSWEGSRGLQDIQVAQNQKYFPPAARPYFPLIMSMLGNTRLQLMRTPLIWRWVSGNSYSVEWTTTEDPFRLPRQHSPASTNQCHLRCPQSTQTLTGGWYIRYRVYKRCMLPWKKAANGPGYPRSSLMASAVEFDSKVSISCL